MKILCKTQEIKILEKDNLIGNLESMVEELEIQILQLGQNVNGKCHTQHMLEELELQILQLRQNVNGKSYVTWIWSCNGVVVKLLACGTRGTGFQPRSCHDDFIDWVAPASQWGFKITVSAKLF